MSFSACRGVGLRPAPARRHAYRNLGIANYSTISAAGNLVTFETWVSRSGRATAPVSHQGLAASNRLRRQTTGLREGSDFAGDVRHDDVREKARPLLHETLSGLRRERCCRMAALETVGDEEVAVPSPVHRPDCHDDPECRQEGNQDAALDREHVEMGDVCQGERRQRADSQREGEGPPAEIERQAISEVANGLEDGEQKPPDTVSPWQRAPDDTQAKRRVTNSGETLGGEYPRGIRAEQDEAERARPDRTKRQPGGRTHITFGQFVQHEPEDQEDEDAHRKRHGIGPQGISKYEHGEALRSRKMRDQQGCAYLGDLGGHHGYQPHSRHLLEAVLLAGKHEIGSRRRPVAGKHRALRRKGQPRKCPIARICSTLTFGFANQRLRAKAPPDGLSSQLSRTAWAS